MFIMFIKLCFAWLQYAGYDNRWGEIVRMRLQYDEARRQVSDLQQQLASIEQQMIPGQNESDKDRCVIYLSVCIQELFWGFGNRF